MLLATFTLGALAVLLAGAALLTDAWESVARSFRGYPLKSTEQKVDAFVYLALWLALLIVIGLAFGVLVSLAIGSAS